MSEWISVKDRMPDGFKWYLVANQAGKIFLAMYSVINKSWLDNDSLLRDPTHWMPLPKPPTLLQLVCPDCRNKETEPFEIGDECYCGGKFKESF